VGIRAANSWLFKLGLATSQWQRRLDNSVNSKM